MGGDNLMQPRRQKGAGWACVYVCMCTLFDRYGNRGEKFKMISQTSHEDFLEAI